MSECLLVSLMPNTHFLFRFLFFASICCYIIRIAMCPSTYLSHSHTQCLPYVSVCLSLSLSPSPSVFTSLCRYSMYVYNCVHLSVTLMSYTCFHIKSSYQLTELYRHACQSDCSSTWLSIHFLCIVAHLSVLLSSFTFSTYYHHFFHHRLVCAAVVSPIQSQHRRLLT